MYSRSLESSIRELEMFLGHSHSCPNCRSTFLAHEDGCPNCGSSITRKLKKLPGFKKVNISPDKTNVPE